MVNNNVTEIINQYFILLKNKDVDAAHDYFAADCQLWIAGGHRGAGRLSADEYRSNTKKFMAKFPDGVDIRLKNIHVVDDNTAICESETIGLTKYGGRYHNHYCIVFKTHHGKIVEYREYHDTHHAYDILVYKPDVS